MLQSHVRTRGHSVLLIAIIFGVTSWPYSASVVLGAKRLESSTHVVSSVGETTILSCFRSNNNPVLWEKRMSDKLSGSPKIVAEDNTVVNGFAQRFRLNTTDRQQNLVIHGTQKNDGGFYDCIEDNGIGRKHTVELRVEDSLANHAPAILHAKVNDTVTLPCRLQATTNISWQFYDDQSARDAINISINGRIMNRFKTRFSLSYAENANDLVILRVKMSDNGVFQCVENNGIDLGQTHYVLLIVTAAKHKDSIIEGSATGVIQPVNASRSQNDAEFFDWKSTLLILTAAALIGLIIILLVYFCRRKRRLPWPAEEIVEIKHLSSSDTVTQCNCQKPALHRGEHEPIVDNVERRQATDETSELVVPGFAAISRRRQSIKH